MNAWVVLATIGSLLFYFATGFQVGRGRAAHGVPAPAMTGHPQFERLVRVQANTLEWLVIYIPCLWMFALYFDGRVAAAVGAVWIVGRVIYARAYARDPSTRTLGFMIQASATLILLVGGLFGAIRAVMS